MSDSTPSMSFGDPELQISVDEQYATFATNFHVAVVFGAFAPFLVFTSTIALVSNVACFYYFATKKNFEIVQQLRIFPSSVIPLSMFMEQFLISLFCFYLLNRIIFYVLVSLLLISDLIFAILFCRLYKEPVPTTKKSAQESPSADLELPLVKTIN